MVDYYAPKRARVAAIIKRWNTGVVTLTRVTHGVRDPLRPWQPAAATSTAIYTLDSRVDETVGQFGAENTVVGSDMKLIVSPKATLAGVEVDIVPLMSDTLTIDGAVKRMKQIDKVPAAGLAARFHIFVES